MLLGEPGLWLAGDDEVEDRIVDLPGTVLDVSVEVDDVAGVAALLPGLQFGCERCDVDGLLPDYSPGTSPYVASRRSCRCVACDAHISYSPALNDCVHSSQRRCSSEASTGQSTSSHGSS